MRRLKRRFILLLDNPIIAIIKRKVFLFFVTRIMVKQFFFYFLVLIPFAFSYAQEPLTFEVIKENYQKKDFIQAIKLSEDYLKKFPNDVDALLYQGLSYKQLNQCDKAIPIFLTILHSKPNYLDARIQAINCLFTLKDYAKSLVFINQALKVNPNQKELLLYQAKAFYLLNQKEAALQTINNLLKKYPNYSPAKDFLNNLNKERIEERSNLSSIQSLKGRFTDLPIGASITPHFIAGIFTDTMLVNRPEQTWNLSNLYGFWVNNWGSFGGSLNYATRYGIQALQGEVNAIPKITKNVFLDLAYAHSNRPELFPTDMERAEIYAYLPNGIEASFGGAHRNIAQFRLNSITGSLGKYFGNYYLNFRPIYFKPGAGSTSLLYRVVFRRHTDKPNQFIGLVLMDGTSPDLTDLLSVDFIRVRNRLILIEGFQPITQSFGFQYGVGYEDLLYPNSFLRKLVHINFGIKIGFA